MKNFTIIDIDGFAKTIRDSAARSMAEDYTENLDEFITISQIKGFIKEYSMDNDKNGSLVITEEIFYDMFERIRNTIYQVGLSKLAAKGHIECAWDNETNSMIFWLNSNTKGAIDIDIKSKSDQ